MRTNFIIGPQFEELKLDNFNVMHYIPIHEN